MTEEKSMQGTDGGGRWNRDRKESELDWIEEIERISVRKRTGSTATVAAEGLNFAGRERILTKEKKREMGV